MEYTHIHTAQKPTPVSVSLYLQYVHLRQPPEGAISQSADVVPLKLQHLQAVKSLECEALDEPNPISIEVP